MFNQSCFQLSTASLSALHTLMPNSLSALAGSLKHLVLSNNLLEEVPSFALRQLRWDQPVLWNNSIWSDCQPVLSNDVMLSPCTHYCCRELDHINLNQNNISHIKDGAFWGLSKVINS